MSEEREEKKEKKLEIINGDGTNLVISPVYEHINAAKPKTKDKNPKYIIIPGKKKEDEKEDSDDK